MIRHRRVWAALLAALLMMLGVQALPAAGQPGKEAADQVLTWTAGNDIATYLSAPKTAVAGTATIVFENSAATGNTTGMPHTLTFVTSDPEFNSDVQLNILANPNDAQGGKHTAQVTLTPGRYFYHCTIPGHGQMQGILTVTEGTGEDTTAPEASAQVSGTQNAQGEYVGSASVALHATDEGGSGVERIEYAIGDAGADEGYREAGEARRTPRRSSSTRSAATRSAIARSTRRGTSPPRRAPRSRSSLPSRTTPPRRRPRRR